MSPGAAVRGALALLRRHAGRVYAVSLAVTLVNTVPDVLRQLLVYDDPSVAHALLVDAVGFGTGLLAQLWLTGALTGLPDDGRVRPRGALVRGTATALRAVRTSPAAVLAGVVLGGGVSALVTIPPSVAALGVDGVLGPLDAPSAAAFTVATVSDVVASALTLPFLALVLVLVAGSTRQFAGKGRS
ncbi:hypothetical protein SAMN05660690_4445 [Geodermatophilus telluris]|uniref:Uncharacterized protein n=1 Tax=Geodermatophilus telluris TaxID=1190417 RepID=A0A1G6VC49_9ACTN|nr:hypothetical protein [Geodermatophilus telluris]SDD51044.1 hypothetical protein SAMN05660690_4445 [Geodermatophilus telluris]